MSTHTQMRIVLVVTVTTDHPVTRDQAADIAAEIAAEAESAEDSRDRTTIGGVCFRVTHAINDGEEIV